MKFFQRLGRSLMLPVAVLPVIVVAIAFAITHPQLPAAPPSGAQSVRTPFSIAVPPKALPKCDSGSETPAPTPTPTPTPSDPDEPTMQDKTVRGVDLSMLESVEAAGGSFQLNGTSQDLLPTSDRSVGMGHLVSSHPR